MRETMEKIMLDAGHGGPEPGAVYQGRQEKDDNLALTLAVGEVLESRGYDVLYTRTDDIYQTPFEKATIANDSGADLFISIHRNAFPTPNTASGVESLVYDKSGIKLEIAEAIDANLAELGFRDLGVKARPNLVVLKRTQMPAVLVEAGFLDNDADNELFDMKFDEIAVAIADGITEVLESTGMYQVQIGLFRQEVYARDLLEELVLNGYPAYLQYDDRGYYVVKVGNYDSLNDAVEMETKLKRDGYQTIVVTT